MGVINLTPDSFSDGDGELSQDGLIAQINTLRDSFDILDFGAESTAPFNKKITAEDEIERFEKFLFPVLKKVVPPHTVSIDTYKIDVFKHVYDFVSKHWPQTNFIFNDISGALDDSLFSLLSSQRRFSYIYSHNLAPTRTESSNHMDYLFEEEDHLFLKHFSEYFKTASKKLSEFKREIIFDPCLGFSKNRKQNHLVLKSIETIFEEQPNSILIGLSRKSFIRFPENKKISDYENYSELDSIQSLLMLRCIEKMQNKIIFRVHDTTSLKAVENYLEVMR